MFQGDATSLKHVDQTSRSCHQKVAALVQVAHLVTNAGSTVDNARTNVRPGVKLKHTFDTGAIHHYCKPIDKCSHL